MKRTATIVLCLCLLAAMSAGCACTGDRKETPAQEPEETAQGTQEPAPKERETEMIFEAKYIRTDGYHDGEQYPKSVLIRSAEGLAAYYEANRKKYALESVEDPASDRTIGFLDAAAEFGDDFFVDHALLLVVLEEGSGSVRHEVTCVKSVPSEDGGTIIVPEIERIVPEVGTDDMAEWHILIGIPAEHVKAETVDIMPSVTAGYASGSDAGGKIPGPDTASVAGPYGQISVVLPGTWTAEAAPVDSGKLVSGLYGLRLKPSDAASGVIELFCIDRFGVCGTGLSEEKRNIAGAEATVGTYDGGAHWDFIVFTDGEHQVVAQHTDCSSWTEAMWDDAMSILDTMIFDPAVAEGGAGRFIRESENDEIGVFMEVSHVTSSGLTVTFRQYDERDTGELLFGEGYLLTRQEADEWTEVPMIIENGAFNDIGYVIPPQGEAELKTDWEWLYGKLVPGTYRITKTVWSTSVEGPVSSYPLTAEFILAG